MRRFRNTRSNRNAAKIVKTLASAFRKHHQGFEAGDGLTPVLAMAIAWAIRMCRTAEAIMVLHRAGFAAEASPLRRSLMEHAAKLRWLVDRKEEALKSIEHAHRRHQRLLAESADKGGWELDAEGRDLPPSDLDMEKPDDVAIFRDVKTLVNRYGDPAWYAIYQLESSTSHATYLSGAVYWDPEGEPEDGFGLRWEPVEGDVNLSVTAAWLAMGLSQLTEISTVPRQIASALKRADQLLARIASAPQETARNPSP